MMPEETFPPPESKPEKESVLPMMTGALGGLAVASGLFLSDTVKRLDLLTTPIDAALSVCLTMAGAALGGGIAIARQELRKTGKLPVPEEISAGPITSVPSPKYSAKHVQGKNITYSRRSNIKENPNILY